MELKDNAANQFNLFNVTSLESATDIFQINSFIPQLLLYQFKTQEWGMCDPVGHRCPTESFGLAYLRQMQLEVKVNKCITGWILLHSS